MPKASLIEVMAAEQREGCAAAPAGPKQLPVTATMPFEYVPVLSAGAKAPVCWHPHLDAVPLVPA